MPTATMSSIVVYTYTSVPPPCTEAKIELKKEREAAAGATMDGHGVTVICPYLSSLVIPLVDEHMHASSIKLEAHCVFLDVML